MAILQKSLVYAAIADVLGNMIYSVALTMLMKISDPTNKTWWYIASQETCLLLAKILFCKQIFDYKS